MASRGKFGIVKCIGLAYIGERRDWACNDVMVKDHTWFGEQNHKRECRVALRTTKLVR